VRQSRTVVCLREVTLAAQTKRCVKLRGDSLFGSGSMKSWITNSKMIHILIQLFIEAGRDPGGAS
jgi:hypothetical protein